MSKSSKNLPTVQPDPAPDELRQLAARINAAHGAAQEAARAAMASARASIFHAREAGEALIEAKGRLGHGSFMAWVGEETTLPHRCATQYMQVAAGWPQLERQIGIDANLTINGALRLLSAPAEGEEAETPPGAEDATPGGNGEATEDVSEGVSGDGAAEGEWFDQEAGPPPTPRYLYSDLLRAWAGHVMGITLQMNEDYGGLKAMLAEKDKWDWREVRSYLLPVLGDLGKTLAGLKREISRACPKR
jgi:hypothetical protein